jgi:tetratricopeptide (TPR) repeat protein
VGASNEYRIVLSYCQLLARANNDGDYTVEQLDEWRVPAQLNFAACLLKLQDYPECAKNCSEVIEKDPVNVKAYFRRGVALARRGLDLDGAEADFKFVLEMEPKNGDAAKELKLLQKKIRASDQNAKKMFGNFFKPADDGKGFYADVETTHDPNEGKAVTERVEDMPDGVLKSRAKFLLNEQDTALAEKEEMEEQLKALRMRRAELMAESEKVFDPSELEGLDV